MKRHIALVALAVTVAACNGSSEGTSTTTTTEATTTTTTEATTTTEPTTTTTEPTFGQPVVIYILDPSGSNGFRQGPFLYPIAVDPLGGGDEPAAALATLVGISGFDDATEIPADTGVDELTLDGSTAVVDLSDEFESGGGSASMFARLAQLTFTLTRIDGIDSVLLVEGGDPVTVFSSEGIVLDGPMVRDDFEDFVPGILVDTPAAGATVPATFDISGVAAAFEGVFQLEVLEGNTVLFAPDFASTGSGIGFGSFTIEAATGAAPGAHLTIRVWENSAQDGSVISERLVPVTVSN
jgi:germination protein M